MFFDQYPYTNMHNVNLDWVLQAVKSWGAMVEQNNQNFIDLAAANESFKEYVTNYITNLDVQEEINNKLDEMLASGALTQYFSPYIKTDVEEWLEENITPTTPAVDASLSIQGAAADAYATGEAIRNINENLEEVLIPYSARLDNMESALDESSTIDRKNSFLKESECTEGKYYYRYDTISNSSTYVIYPEFRIVKGRKYFYKNIIPSFTWALYDGAESAVNIIGTGTNPINGWFFALNDGTVKVSTTLALKADAIFTDFEVIFDQATQNDLYEVSGYTVEDLNLYHTAGVYPGYPSNAQGGMTNGGRHARVSVEAGKTYKILYPGYTGSFASGAIGFIAFYNNETPISGVQATTLNPQTYEGTDKFITVLIPDGCNVLRFAVQLASLDILDTCIMCESIYEFDDLETKSGISSFNGWNLIDRYARLLIGSGSAKSILANKLITVIGDSITEHTVWADTGWVDYVQSWTGAAFQNLGASGCGFCASPNHYIADIGRIDSNASVIGVACSFNDMTPSLPTGDITDTGTTSRCGYVNTFFDTLLTAHPDKPIICYIQGPWGQFHKGIASTDEYVSKVKQICNLKGIPFYDGLYENGCTLKPWIADNASAYFLGDQGTQNTIHPNSIGHLVIARYLVSKFVDNVVANEYIE